MAASMKRVVMVILQVLVGSSYSLGQTAPQTDITCEKNDGHFVFNMKLQCEPDQVIRIDAATWGRSDTTGVTCPTTQARTDVYCVDQTSSDLITVRELCHGKDHCSIEPTNQQFVVDPCENVYKYLNVTWHCAPAALVCQCHGDSTRGVETYDGTQLAIMSAQKTHMSTYKGQTFKKCKFRLRARSDGYHVHKLFFSFGPHPSKASKFYRDLIITSSGVIKRGVGISGAVNANLTYVFKHDPPHVLASEVDNWIKVQSAECPYVLDVDISVPDTLVYSLTVDGARGGGELNGMCGNCNSVDDEYMLNNGTDVSGLEDRLKLMSDNFAL